ncbi:MAG: helix-turn-helix transcriptional regulator [Bacteroidales bacterium]|nr:helix-turn-helix transcriptional regulator [Bacteroidales bacterium]
MILSKLLSVIYLAVLILIAARWRRSRFALSGNEVFLMSLALPVVLLLPADIVTCAMRLSVYGAMFGMYVFWCRILNKGMLRMMPYIAIFTGLFILAETILMLSVGNAVWAERYLAIYNSVWMLPLLFLFVERRDERYLKHTISVSKIFKSMLWALPFVLLSGSTILLIMFCDKDKFVAMTSILLTGVLPLGYMYLKKPACLMYNERAYLRKKAYILGRGIRGGQLMGEETGLMNETMVEDVRIIYNLITLFENEKLYRNVDVKISDVARMIGTNKTYLSRALNTRISKNFCQFVNHYRVKEVCSRYIEDPDTDMRGLGEQCGFSSSSNFTNVFKFNTGYTPHDWCRLVKLKMERDEPVQADDFLL